eukprot:GHUV01025172.1.p1 GENE.GHUV01025172.1~~GHUV01025172.1.p1  ORF type:complete len:199 (-),score=51.20 GHUV01025172.1:586-1182(-)
MDGLYNQAYYAVALLVIAATRGDMNYIDKHQALLLVLRACFAYQAANVEKAESYVKAMEGLYKQAYDAALAYEKERKSDQDAKQPAKAADSSETSPSGKDTAAAEGVAEGVPPPITISAHAKILYGNQLYEWSQMLAAVGREWKPILDEAVKCFKEAGCSEADIRGALKNHTQVRACWHVVPRVRLTVMAKPAAAGPW